MATLVALRHPVTTLVTDSDSRPRRALKTFEEAFLKLTSSFTFMLTFELSMKLDLKKNFSLPWLF